MCNYKSILKNYKVERGFLKLRGIRGAWTVNYTGTQFYFIITFLFVGPKTLGIFIAFCLFVNCPNIFDKCFYSTERVIRDVYQLIVLSLKIPEKGQKGDKLYNFNRTKL